MKCIVDPARAHQVAVDRAVGVELGAGEPAGAGEQVARNALQVGRAGVRLAGGPDPADVLEREAVDAAVAQVAQRGVLRAGKRRAHVEPGAAQAERLHNKLLESVGVLWWARSEWAKRLKLFKIAKNGITFM